MLTLALKHRSRMIWEATWMISCLTQLRTRGRSRHKSHLQQSSPASCRQNRSV